MHLAEVPAPRNMTKATDISTGKHRFLVNEQDCLTLFVVHSCEEDGWKISRLVNSHYAHTGNHKILVWKTKSPWQVHHLLSAPARPGHHLSEDHLYLELPWTYCKDGHLTHFNTPGMIDWGIVNIWAHHYIFHKGPVSFKDSQYSAAHSHYDTCPSMN